METRLSYHQQRMKPAGKEEAARADEAPGNQDAIFMQMSKLIKEKQERMTISLSWCFCHPHHTGSLFSMLLLLHFYWSLGWDDPLEEEMAIHSNILAWKIPWTEEPGGLQSMGQLRIRHDWATTKPTCSPISPPLMQWWITQVPHPPFWCRKWWWRWERHGEGHKLDEVVDI